MKLLISCGVVLLLFSAVVIYQQKQKMEELRGALANSSEQIESLQHQLELAKTAAKQARPDVVVQATQSQNPPPQDKSWMFDKSHPNPLRAPDLGAGGSHKR